MRFVIADLPKDSNVPGFIDDAFYGISGYYLGSGVCIEDIQKIRYEDISVHFDKIKESWLDLSGLDFRTTRKRQETLFEIAGMLKVETKNTFKNWSFDIKNRYSNLLLEPIFEYSKSSFTLDGVDFVPPVITDSIFSNNEFKAHLHSSHPNFIDLLQRLVLNQDFIASSLYQKF